LVIGSKPRQLVLGFMVATATLSMWVSNTATAMMMLPVALAIVPAEARQRLTAEDANTAGSAPATPSCFALADGWQRIRAGEGEAGIALACGTINATYHRTVGLFDLLAEPIIEHFGPEDQVCRALDSLLAELAAPQPGTRALAAALMQQCLMLLLRRHCRGGARHLPWLAALADPRLARAVEAILDHPEEPHTVESLARLAGMSRSTFSDHFTAAFGRAPMDFLRDVRLSKASRLLRSSDRPIKQLALSVGYDSRSYFSRAFKAHFGVSPAAYRNRATAGPEAPSV